MTVVKEAFGSVEARYSADARRIMSSYSSLDDSRRLGIRRVVSYFIEGATDSLPARDLTNSDFVNLLHAVESVGNFLRQRKKLLDGINKKKPGRLVGYTEDLDWLYREMFQLNETDRRAFAELLWISGKDTDKLDEEALVKLKQTWPDALSMLRSEQFKRLRGFHLGQNGTHLQLVFAPLKTAIEKFYVVDIDGDIWNYILNEGKIPNSLQKVNKQK